MTLEIAADFPISDVFYLEGVASPGRCRVVGAGTPRGWDEIKGYAQSGATLVPTGDPLSHFSIFVDLWDPATQMPAWNTFASRFLVRSVRLLPGSLVPRALGILHPQLTTPPLSIVQVAIEDCSQLTEDDDGLWTAEIKMIDYRAIIAALPKAKGATPAHTSAAPTAEDEADAQIQALGQQAAGLAPQLFGGP